MCFETCYFGKKKFNAMTSLKGQFLIAVMLTGSFFVPLIAQKPFECDGAFYFISSGSNNNSQLLRIFKDSTSANNTIFNTVANDLGRQVTAIGFNVGDNFIYGLERGSWSLLRIGADGSVQDLGIPLNLDLSLDYFTGEIRPDGGRLNVIGREPGGNDQSLYTISLQAPYYASLASIVSDEPVRTTDMAWDPVLGTLFAFDELKKRLVKVTIGGLVTSVHYESQPQIGPLGALFFDRWGQLYGVDGGANQDEALLRFNKFNGTVKNTFTGPGGGNWAEECSCPYRIDLFKRIEPRAVVPCSEVLVTYLFHNTAGTAYGQKVFTDEFPPEFTITEIIRKPHSTVVSGVGSNLLHLEGMEVLLDKDSIVIKVNVGDFASEYKGQAFASGFPLGLGGTIPSDDPATAEPDDPTTLLVADEGQVIFPQHPLICPGGAIRLEAARNGLNYLWSNGSTTSDIVVSQPGTYWVAVTGDCGLYQDTVEVEAATPPWIDLGQNRDLPFGQLASLPYSTNATGPLAFNWNFSNASPDCLNCPHPRIILMAPTIVNVTITDQNGCMASDDLVLGIRDNRRIFFPNAFSPNGDGINDTFYPQAEGAFFISNFRVFDRWGGVLFEKTQGRVNDPASGWDGAEANGKILNQGTYLWLAEIEFPDGAREWFAGEVVLVR